MKVGADRGKSIGASERACVQGPLVDGPPVGVDNTHKNDPKPKEKANPRSSNLSSPSFLWQGLHAAKSPWI